MSARILRILDASFNRAREGLRVLEDAARFALDDAGLSARLKNARHDLTAAVAPVLESHQALTFRDTAGDVGTTLKTTAELTRADLNEIVLANASRCGEALRSIEEFAKSIDSNTSSLVEKIRYQLYDIERDFRLRLRPASKMAEVRLYVLITESLCKRPWLETAALAIEGGADCLQFREKNLESGDLAQRAQQFVSLCRSHGVLSIINDRADIALLSDADGVHLGQSDLSIRDARQIVGPHKIIGKSTHNLEQAIRAQQEGADYIGIGPMFPSTTKPRDFVAGLEIAREVAKQISIPTVAIGGINHARAASVYATGVTAIAVTQAICESDDPARASRDLRAASQS